VHLGQRFDQVSPRARRRLGITRVVGEPVRQRVADDDAVDALHQIEGTPR